MPKERDRVFRPFCFFTGWKFLYRAISREIDEEDSKRDIYQYCSSIIKNPKSRMEFWKETCTLDVLNYKQCNTLDRMLRIQPALFKDSTSALLKELDNYINKHF